MYKISSSPQVIIRGLILDIAVSFAYRLVRLFDYGIIRLHVRPWLASLDYGAPLVPVQESIVFSSACIMSS